MIQHIGLILGSDAMFEAIKREERRRLLERLMFLLALKVARDVSGMTMHGRGLMFHPKAFALVAEEWLDRP